MRELMSMMCDCYWSIAWWKHASWTRSCCSRKRLQQYCAIHSSRLLSARCSSKNRKVSEKFSTVRECERGGERGRGEEEGEEERWIIRNRYWSKVLHLRCWLLNIMSEYIFLFNNSSYVGKEINSGSFAADARTLDVIYGTYGILKGLICV